MALGQRVGDFKVGDRIIILSQTGLMREFHNKEGTIIKNINDDTVLIRFNEDIKTVWDIKRDWFFNKAWNCIARKREELL